MSLALASNRNMTPYLALGNFAADPAITIEPQGNFLPTYRYIDRTNVVQMFCESRTLAVISNKTIRIDPELADSTSSSVGTYATGQRFFMGDFEPLSGAQRMFGRNSSDNVTSTLWLEINVDNPLGVLGSVFPMIAQGQPSAASGITSPDEFWWAIVPNTGPDACFFPTQETTGKALYSWTGCRHSDLVFYTNVLVDVDLATGEGRIVTEVPLMYRAGGPNHQFEQGALLGETVDVEFKGIQFVADNDSTNLAPKGQLLLSAWAIDAAGRYRFYVKFVDWNPTGAAGSPTRIHTRERLITRIICDPAATQSTVLPDPALRVRLGAPALANTQSQYFVLDRSRNVLVLVSSIKDNPDPPLDRSNAILTFSNVPELSTLRNPAPFGAVETGRIVQFQTDARGDLGEPVGGLVCAWSIKRTSSKGELLATSGQPFDALIPVANGPVDLDLPYPKQLLEDATPLAEGGVYDWVASGVQFKGGAHPAVGKVYLVDYPHTANPVEPSHGQLLSASSVTDDVGSARTRVRYADDADLAEQRDRLEVEAT